MFGRTVAAALAMGNAAVVKPAEEACSRAAAVAELCAEAGFPEGAVNVVPGLGERPARRSPIIAASTSSPLPAVPKSARWCRSRRPGTISAARWSLAASHRRSFLAMPIWRQRSIPSPQRDCPECRPDLFGRIACAHRAPGLGQVHGRSQAAFRAESAPGRRKWTSISGRDQPDAAVADRRHAGARGK